MYVNKFFDLIKVYDIPDTKIRIGSPHDGGYVVPQDIIRKIPNLYSIGIGDNMDFELHFCKHYGNVVCFDPYISNLPFNSDFIKSTSDPKEANAIQIANRTISLERVGPGVGGAKIQDIRRKYMNLTDPSILKVDIEGEEWEHIDYYGGHDMVIIELHILTVHDNQKRSTYFTSLYRQLNEYVNERLFKDYYFMLSALLNSYFIYHIHANNSLSPVDCLGHTFPPLLELTMLNRKYMPKGAKEVNVFPILGLDSPNKTDRNDLNLMLPL